VRGVAEDDANIFEWVRRDHVKYGGSRRSGLVLMELILMMFRCQILWLNQFIKMVF
jgi:hypothetical protein